MEDAILNTQLTRTNTLARSGEEEIELAIMRDGGPGLTCVRPQVGSQGLFPGEDAVAELALDRGGRRRALDHQVGQRLGPRTSPLVVLRAAAAAARDRRIAPLLHHRGRGRRGECGER